MASVYEINKGINKPIEFKGLKAQYVMYLAGGMVGLFVLFAVMYLAGVSVYLCLVVVGGAGFSVVSWVTRLSHKYGEFGLMKASGFKRVPPAIIGRSRKIFTGLSSNTNKQKL